MGAVIFDPKTLAVVSIGYNDTPTDKLNCGDGGCEACSAPDPVRLNLDCYCAAEGQRVLMDNLTWKPIEAVEVGEGILAFGEKGEVVGHGERRYVSSPGIILAKVPSIKEVWEYSLSDKTTLVLTPDHQVLTHVSPTSSFHQWREIGSVPIGEHASLQRWLVPWEKDNSYEAGWLSGFFDGEGCLSYSSRREGHSSLWISAAQAKGETLDRCRLLLEERKFQWSALHMAPGAGRFPKSADRTSILGGWPEQARFLGQIRPKRLLKTWSERKEEYLGRSLITKPVHITASHPMGMERVWDITTTTGTFILEGMAVHNCVHAEMNAVLLAARRGTSVDGCSIIIIGCEEVCKSCQKHLLQAGIKEIYIGALGNNMHNQGAMG